MENQIPLVDLVAAHRDQTTEFTRVFESAVRSGRFIGGPEVSEFENEFAAYCGSRRCVGVSSGTDALRLALMAAGISPGDSVVTVPHTFIATAEAISQAGCLPEFVDVNPQTFNMDARSLRAFLEEGCSWDVQSRRLVSWRTRRRVAAVVPVHLYGQCADMDPILSLAARYDLRVVEDACQAHGAGYYSRKSGRTHRAGTLGDAAAFSFYPGKNLGAFGEAGAVTTDNDELADQVSLLRDHGQTRKYVHEVEGFNARLDAIQAGVLRIKLRRLEEWNQARRALAHRYSALLESVSGVCTPYEPSWSQGVYHLYVICTEARDQLARHLASRGVATGLHYPTPLHLLRAYAGLGYKRGDFPNAERAAEQILSLPMYPQLEAHQQDVVVDAIANAAALAPVKPVAAKASSGFSAG